MNVIISNEQQAQVANLDVDVIKSITGTYAANEIVEMFRTFFYSKMIIDVTALKNYTNIHTFRALSEGLDPDKIVFFIPEGSSLCTTKFLSKLVTLGIYNFTTNLNGIPAVTCEVLSPFASIGKGSYERSLQQMKSFLAYFGF